MLNDEWERFWIPDLDMVTYSPEHWPKFGALKSWALEHLWHAER